MTFLYPYNLLWALLAIPLLLLYVAPAFSRPRKVSSLPLWNAALAKRSPWRQWRRIVSLAMHMATLLLLVIALMHPRLTMFGNGRRMVIIVDTSASMSAGVESVKPLALAKRDARRLLNRLGYYDQAAVLSTHGDVTIRSRMSNDMAALHAAVDSISHTAAPGDLHNALQTAHAMTAGNDDAEIIVLTDHAGAGALKLSVAASGDNAKANTKIIIVGNPAPNSAITRLTARPVPTADNAYDVTIEVSNFSDKAGDITLSAGMLNLTPEKTVLNVPPGGSVTHSLLVTPPEDGWFQAELKSTVENDSLAADNRAWLALKQRTRKNVALVTGGNRQLEPAFQAFPRYKTTVYENSESAPATADVTVFDRTTPDTIPAGPVIVFFPTGACDLWQTPAVVTRYKAAWKNAPQLSRGVEIERISLEDVAQMKFNTKAATLAAAPDGTPLVSRIDRASGPVYVIHIDLRQSDWTLRPQFPLFTGNLLQQTAPQQDAIQTPFTTANNHAIPASKPRQLTSPAGETTTLPAAAPPRFTDVGFWKLGDKLVAVNLLNATESNLQPAETPATVDIDTVPYTTDGLPLWLWFVIAAAMVAVGEWWMFQRRVTV